MKINEIISEGPYNHNATHEVYWDRLKPDEKAEWAKRRSQLESRSRKVFQRLTGLMPEEDRSAIKGVPVNVPLHGEMAWAAADFEKRVITVDLGCFWDLPDDCLAYTLGHEIGHFVYERKNPGFWRKRIPGELNKKLEMDADVYGAILAYRLGYNPKLAWNLFTRAERERPYDPKHHTNYPTVKQRDANINMAIKKDKENRAAAKTAAQQPNVPADQQGQTQPNTTSTQGTANQSPEVDNSQPMGEPPLSPAARVDLSHAKHGIEILLKNLNADPELALQMFPSSGTSDTALA